MARQFGDRISIFAVSPGACVDTDAGRNAPAFQKFLFYTVMPLIGSAMGVHQPVGLGTKRYLDVLHSGKGDYVNGGTYASAPKKLVGPMEETTAPHLLDAERQDNAFRVISELSGVSP